MELLMNSLVGMVFFVTAAHVLIYALDRAILGAKVLEELARNGD